MIVALAGGTGAAKLLRGFTRVLPPDRLTIVGNTGDDLEWWGLHVSPDLDSVAYALAGLLDPVKGWGVRDDTFHCRGAMAGLGRETWFSLGDRDLATHVVRTALLRGGATLTDATAAIARALGLHCRLYPMSDDPVRTRVRTPDGWLGFQEFFVRERAQPEVIEVAYEGADRARPAPGVVEAIGAAAAVVVCCSNPVTAIGPILAVPGVVDALAATPAPVGAVSPIIGGVPVSDTLVIDTRDASLAPEFARRGGRPVVAETLMTDAAGETTLARAVLADVGLA